MRITHQILGIKELYRPADGIPEVDIVAVHGLNGHATDTWTAQAQGICWLNHPDFLPKYLPRARVLVWGYNAKIASVLGGRTSSDRILQHAQTLVHQLEADRDLESATRLTAPKRVVNFENNLVNALEEQSETLQNITDQFSPLMAEFRIYFFWEQERTDLKYTVDYIVEESSAAPILDNTERCGIAADHRGMCKFHSNGQQGFRTAVAALRRYAREAPEAIQLRHTRETDSRYENQLFQAAELLRSSPPPDKSPGATSCGYKLETTLSGHLPRDLYLV
ncbi:hypothetical protein EYZ11_000284 [Aspergillus tanneri]|uniref:DUF676 domain-containing protein n=1 Tax=Aspergillus tanneri TaxID=1220188 RepID=A0A4S3JXY5_9EURO|nr:hypothetical protein EYZ11_000284 [Aspergillus tanneri]